MSDTKKKTVKVSEDLHKKIKTIAVKEGKLVERVVEDAIKKGLPENGK
jgi:predicted transcriptional regulator